LDFAITSIPTGTNTKLSRYGKEEGGWRRGREEGGGRRETEEGGRRRERRREMGGRLRRQGEGTKEVKGQEEGEPKSFEKSIFYNSNFNIFRKTLLWTPRPTPPTELRNFSGMFRSYARLFLSHLREFGTDYILFTPIFSGAW
jgi:hypothetical protein